MVLRLVLASLVMALAGAMPAFAQQADNAIVGRLDTGSVISPILTIDSERLYRDSIYGQRVIKEDAARLTDLGVENRKIEADLAAEEQGLTVKRPTLAPEEFRVLADAFDEKVQQIKQTQVAKQRDLKEQLEKEQEIFWAAAGPVLERLMRDADALVILERRTVFVSVSAVEITDAAIEMLDDTLGDGTAPE